MLYITLHFKKAAEVKSHIGLWETLITVECKDFKSTFCLHDLSKSNML